MAKVGLETLPPFSYGVLRIVVAMAVLAVLMRGAGRLRRPVRRDLAIVVSFGLLGIAAAIITMNLALPWVEAGRASILSYTLPLWVVPIVAAVLHVRPTRPELAGLALGLAGLALLLNPAAIDWSSPQVLAGCGLLLTGAVSGAAALVHVRAHRWQGTPLDVQIWQLLVALVPIGILAAILERDDWATVDWRLDTLLIVLYSGALATAFAFWASQSVVRAIGPTTTSIGYLAVPVVGILGGVVFLGESVSLLDVLGLLVTTAGITVVLQAGRATPATRLQPAADEPGAAPTVS